MRTMDHPNVVGLKHCFFSTTSKIELFLNLVIEYVPETMYRVLKHYSNANQRMSLMYVKLYTYQICRGPSYMHVVPGVCHRDLKPQTVLVDPLSQRVKICDFESAKMLAKGELKISYICSQFYRTLELIFGVTYTTSIDIWSAGYVLPEFLLGQPLFPGENAVDQLVEIIKVLGTPTREEICFMNLNYTDFSFSQIKAHPWHKVFHKRMPPEAIDLASRLMQYSPVLRCSALQTCSHPYIFYSAVKAGPCGLTLARSGSFGRQVILSLAHIIEHEEFMEVVKLENMGLYQDDMIFLGDIFLLQLCNVVNENAIGNCAELIFAPIDATFFDDAPLLPSGFHIIPIDSGADPISQNQTLDLASAPEVRPAGNRASSDYLSQRRSAKSVMTLAFQFACEIHLQENVVVMAQQYLRSTISSVQRVVWTLSPSQFGSQVGSDRLWVRSAQVLMKMVGHTSIVYYVNAHATGLIVSGCTDCFAKIWEDGVCVQSIEHPGSVWDAKFMENGDIVTACSDGVVRVWTVHHDRVAEPLEVDSYESLLSQYKYSR